MIARASFDPQEILSFVAISVQREKWHAKGKEILPEPLRNHPSVSSPSFCCWTPRANFPRAENRPLALKDLLPVAQAKFNISKAIYGDIELPNWILVHKEILRRGAVWHRSLAVVNATEVKSEELIRDISRRMKQIEEEVNQLAIIMSPMCTCGKKQ